MMLRVYLLLWLWAISSAAAPPTGTGSDGASGFRLPQDTFAYPNELLWEYHFDAATGRTLTSRRTPEPDYTLHCYVMTRATRLFFDHARFEPNEPKATHAVYRYLVRRVLAFSPSVQGAHGPRIVIPGYASLYEFSKDYGALLKSESGGAWRSYTQRGNWRVVFPFTRRQQEGFARELVQSLASGRLPIVHLVRFPKLNHTLLVYSCVQRDGQIDFQTYDPNQPGSSRELIFDRARRSFVLGPNNYFAGGPINAYEIYRGLLF